MPKVEPQNETARTLTGFHLYHAGWSNCSMRVRMVLAEKGVDWTSHHLDTRSGEHISPEYFGIHPKGLVPALVHDGEVWIESNDIIEYLDDVCPGARLTPDDDAGRDMLSHWMALASNIHVAGVKTYIYSVVRRRKHGRPPQDSTSYRQLQSDEELLRFHARTGRGEGLDDREREKAEHVLHAAFAEVDAYLGNHEWLAGNRFSLADISWLPLHYTLARAGFPFDPYTNLERWAAAIKARPSFTNAVEKWFDGPP